MDQIWKHLDVDSGHVKFLHQFLSQTPVNDMGNCIVAKQTILQRIMFLWPIPNQIL